MGSNRREGTMELLDESFDIPLETEWVQPEEEKDLKPTGPERKPCPDCGREMTWLADGSRPRKHKCEPKEGLPEPGAEHPPLTTESVCAGQPVSDQSQVTADLVISKFVETRDTINKIKKRHKEEIAELSDLQDRRAMWLKGELDRMGLDSFKTAHGSCFTVEKSSTSVADRQAFLSWVHEDWINREGFLENRVSKMAVKQQLEDGEVLPPGVNYTTFKDVQIRRS